MQVFFNLLKDTRGATAVEYTLLVATIAIALIGALNTIASNSADNYEALSAAVTDAD